MLIIHCLLEGRRKKVMKKEYLKKQKEFYIIKKY
jgi:hypothetical protein